MHKKCIHIYQILEIPTYTVIRANTLNHFQDYFPPTLLFGLHAYSAP